MNDLAIRRMTQKDVRNVSLLEEKVFSQPWGCGGFLDALAQEHAIFLVAEAENKLAGYCGMYCALDQGEITNVAVAEEFRRCGIARALMRQLLSDSKEMGIRNVFLEVRMSNEGAIRLYESMGFQIQGVRKGFYQHPKEDGYVMMRSQ